MKTVIRFMKSLGVKINRLKEFFKIPKSSLYEILKEKEHKDHPLVHRIRNLAYEFPFYGYRRIYMALRKEGFTVNHKKVYRLYKSLNLERKNKKKKKVISFSSSIPIKSPTHRNEIWTMDFIHDSLAIGKGIRILIIMDIFTRKVVGFKVDTSIGGSGVTELLKTSIEENGKLEVIRSDNGPEFISKTLDRFLFKGRIKHEFIEKGKPYQNGYIESFMDKIRNECLNLYLFRTIYEARVIIGKYIDYYNNERPHSAIGYEAPVVFNKNLYTIKL